MVRTVESLLGGSFHPMEYGLKGYYVSLVVGNPSIELLSKPVLEDIPCLRHQNSHARPIHYKSRGKQDHPTHQRSTPHPASPLPEALSGADSLSLSWRL